MLQEIVTYLIVGIAVTVATLKIVARFKKKKPQKINYQKEKFTMAHDCGSCSADCMLRDATKSVKADNVDLCNELHEKSE